jgi:hypothetical protein
MVTDYTRKEKSLLRQLAREAWEAELTGELEILFERFGDWADNGISAFDLSDRIHEFHNGVSRELYTRYTALPPQSAVARAVAVGILGEESIDPSLLEKLRPLIEAFRD